MSIYRNQALCAPRPAFVEAFPSLKAEHRKLQCGFFGAVKTAGLSTDKDKQLAGINALLGTALTSRTQLTVEETEAVITTIEAGGFNTNWTLTGTVRAEIEIIHQINLVATTPAIRCSTCKERPVHYFFATLDGQFLDTEKGICRECAPVQEGEEMLDSDAIPASLAVIEEQCAERDANLIYELDAIIAEEEAHERALAALEEEAAKLRRRIKTLDATLNDKDAFHGKSTIKVLKELKYQALGRLRHLENEYPFI